MKRIIAIAAVVLIIAIGVVAYSFLRTPEEASGPIAAIPITTDAREPTGAEVGSATAEETNASVGEAVPQPDAALETDTVAESGTQAETGTAPGARLPPVSRTTRPPGSSARAGATNWC